MSDEILDGVVRPGPPPAEATRIEAVFDTGIGTVVEMTTPEGAPVFAFDLAGPGPQQPPPPAMTMEQLLEVARPLTDSPQLGRLEVGTLARKALTDAYKPGSPGPADPLGALFGTVTLYGVPIIVPRGDEALEPDAWRLLDTAGEVISEGTL